MPLPLIAGAAIQALPAILGLFGNKKDKKRRNAQEDKASAGFSQLTDILKGQLGQDYFDSAEGMGAMTEIDQNSQDQANQINAAANVNGMTDEARIAMMGKNLSAKQGAYAGLAQNAGLWRQRALQNYQGALGNLFSAGMNNRNNSNRSISNIVGGFQSGIDGAANAGVFDKLLGVTGSKGANAASGMSNPAFNLFG